VQIKIVNKVTGKVRDVTVLPGEQITIGANEQILVAEAFVVSRATDTVVLADPEAPQGATVTVKLGSESELVLVDAATPSGVISLPGSAAAGAASGGGFDFAELGAGAWWLIGGAVAAAGAVSIALLAGDDSNTVDGAPPGPGPSPNPNDAPVATGDIATTDEDTSVLIDVLANDTDADNVAPTAANAGLSIKPDSLVVDPAQGTAVIEAGQIRFTPAGNFNGTATITYVVTDGVREDIGSVTVTVNAANDAPVAVDDVAATAEDTSVLVNVIANDTGRRQRRACRCQCGPEHQAGQPGGGPGAGHRGD
jgi:hypothetical protein